jgi:anti-anti-sigma factor
MPTSPTRPVTDDLDCTVTEDGGKFSVSFEGAVDFYTGGRAKKLLLGLLDHQPAGLTVDVRGAFVDSSGIGVLLQVAQRTRLERRSFRLICHGRLEDVLRLHHLDDVLGLGEPAPAEPLQAPARIAA